MLVFLLSPNQDKGAHAIDFCMQLAFPSVLEDKQVQRSFFGVLSHIINPDVNMAGYPAIWTSR